MSLSCRSLWNNILKYIAYIMFSLEESNFCLPLDDVMKSQVEYKCD